MKTDFNLLTLFSNPNNISIAKSYDRYDNVLSIDLDKWKMDIMLMLL